MIGYEIVSATPLHLVERASSFRLSELADSRRCSGVRSGAMYADCACVNLLFDG